MSSIVEITDIGEELSIDLLAGARPGVNRPVATPRREVSSVGMVFRPAEFAEPLLHGFEQGRPRAVADGLAEYFDGFAFGGLHKGFYHVSLRHGCCVQGESRHPRMGFF